MARYGVLSVMAGRRAAGPEAYEVGLVRSLAAIDSDNRYEIFCTSAASPGAFAVDAPNVRYRMLRPSLRPVALTISFPLDALRSRIDLLHATLVPPWVSPVPYVFTHHCLSSFFFPEFYEPAIQRRLNPLIERGLKRAEMIICVSENTRLTTQERFGIPAERMRVVPNGLPAEFRGVDRVRARRFLAERHGITAPFFLYLGKLEARKNIDRLLRGYAAYCADVDDPVDLVLVGRRHQTCVDIDAVCAELGISGRVREIGWVEEGEPQLFYSAAVAFLFPSLWEGFGIPIVEAMACGAPVVTSTVSAMPEVAGDAALLVDPRRVEEIAAALVRLHDDPSLRDRLSAAGLARADLYSWDRTARQTLEVYRELCG